MNMMTMIFDKATAGLSPIEKMKLLRQLKMTRTDIAALGAGALAAMKRLKLAAQAKLIRVQLGAPKKLEENQPLAPVDTSQAAINEIAIKKENEDVVKAPIAQQTSQEGQAQQPAANPAQPTATPGVAAPVEDPVKKSISRRQKDNNAAIEALRKVKAGEADAKDPAIREALKGYSGSGGGLKTAQGTSGSPHEYYTPAPVAKAMWDMLDGLGFTGGKVLDPSSGMGVFARTKPDSVAIEQIELDSVSGEINGLLNDGPTVSTRVASFEEVAASTDDETFDAVVTNVPFGDKAMRGAHWRKDKKYQNANLQEYFILRGLEKIKPNGFAAFIVPPSVVAGKGGKGVSLRNNVSMAAEFVGAYRLPNVVFDEAGADTITDIIILRKHSKDNKAKIDELAQQNAALLTQANVIWPDFVDGNYFKLEGKRFQIGESMVGKGRFGEVEKVAFTGSIGSIAALLKPFPKSSRIDWALLGTVETVPIVYAEGDTVFSGGAMLQMVDGKLIPVEGGLSNDDAEAVNLMARFTSPLEAINQGLTFDDASRALTNEETCGRLGSVPRWIVSAQRAAKAASKSQGEWFDAIMAGMAVQEFAQSGNKEPVDYAADYPALSNVLARVQGYASKRAGVGGEVVAEALQNIAVARKKGMFTSWWTGNVAKDETLVLTVNQSYAKIKLESEDETGYVPAGEMRKAFADFDPLNDDAWCVSPDGSGVMSADDYYFGNYAEFLARAKQELSEATDPAIKEKLLRQHAKASERITLVNPSRMKFSLETAFVSEAEKAEFIKQYVSEDIQVGVDSNGKPKFSYEGKAPDKYASADEVRRIKTLRRFAIYLNSKTITTGSGDRALDDPKEEQALLDSIKAMVNASTAQFDAWCKSNEEISSGISRRLNAPENLRFVEVPDYAPVDIPNWNPAWVPHGYQYAAVRRYSKRFSGILALDVGLGKTLTALAAVQYAQSIGSKKKTVFVVPNSVLTNWKKEASKAYQDTSDCLFVGLQVDAKGKAKYSSKAATDDLNAIRENRHSKIFMTYETLTRIPLREDTLQAYKDYLLANDDSFSKQAEEGANEKTRDKISAEQAVANALESGSKAGNVPYFEDMGIDSIVIDEAHCFPAGTLVDGVPIETIKVGDLVSSVNHETGMIEMKPVTAVMSRVPNAMVRVFLTNGKSVACTPDHPFWTKDGGYLNAYQLDSSLQVMINSFEGENHDNMCALPNGISDDARAEEQYSQESECKGVLRTSLQQGRENSDKNEISAGCSQLHCLLEGVHTQHKPSMEIKEWGENGVLLLQDMCVQGGLCAPGISSGIQLAGGGGQASSTGGAEAASESAVQLHALPKVVHFEHGAEVRAAVGQERLLHVLQPVQGPVGSGSAGAAGVTAGCRGKTAQEIGFSEHSGSHQEADCSTSSHGCVGRERKAATECAPATGRCIELAGGVPCHDEAQTSGWVQGDVPPGHCQPRSEAGHRGGRTESQVWPVAGAGPQERRSVEFIGVDHVEVLEQTSDGRFGGVCQDGLVYDITVDGNHNFFAEGILVHNCFKNSKRTSSEFKSARFIANPENSKRGTDMQAKCWYVRGISCGGDGVMALTATPVSNTPSEVFSLMALTIGEKELNAMCGCTGTDSFMMNTCDVENREEDDLTGAPKSRRTLKGIANLDILRRVLDSAAMIETPETVASKGILIEVPEAEEAMSSVEMSPVDTAILIEIKKAYLDAAAMKKVRVKLSPKEAIMASPFNAIRNMTKLITDKELYQGKFLFGFSAKEKAKAESVVAAFNKLKITEECKEYELPFGIDTTGMKSKMVTDNESGNEAMIFYVPVLASIEGNKIVLPAVDYQTHDRFMTIVGKNGLGLTANASPKIKALLANLQKENASPRWKPAKQIVFCDELALHHKLKLLIAAETGIPGVKICIVNAKSVSPDEIQNVQDGFNANEDDNQYQIIIANKKAEVGINLQNGTQAIHHLTIGWTPDSIHQRNGRGVRQGNKVETPIMIYHYEANGTFDAYKRRLVSVKGDWIKSLMDKDTENVAIEGDLSAEDYARMTSLVGDSDAMAQFNSDMAKKAKAQVAQSAKITQVNSLSVAMGQQKWLDKFEHDSAGFTAWVKAKAAASGLIADEIEKLYQRSVKTESTDVANRCRDKIAELTVKRDAIDALYAGIPNADSKWLNVTASQHPDTAAVANWGKDVAINRKMLDEANAACLTRVTQGYSKETLDKVASKEAILMGGKILAAGDLVIADGKPGILKMQQQRGNPSLSFIFQDAERGMQIGPVAGMSITMHGTLGSEERTEILKMLVDLDEDQIKAGNTGNLFANQSVEVRGALRSVIPSPRESYDGKFASYYAVWVASPNFPLVMPPDATGPFCESIVAAQASLIEISQGSDRWAQKTIRFKDLRNQGSKDGREEWESVAGWMVANNKTMTMQEVIDLGGDSDDFQVRLRHDFSSALDAMVAKCGNLAELDAAIVEWARATYPWVTGFDASLVQKFSLERFVASVKAKLDDGSVKYDAVIQPDIRYSGALVKMVMAIQSVFEGGAMNAELLAFIENNHGQPVGAKTLAYYAGDADLVERFKQLVIDAVGAKKDGELVDMSGSPFAEELRVESKLGKGAVIKFNPQGSIYNPGGLNECIYAYAIKQKQAGMDLDIDGLLAQISNVRGVASAKVGMANHAKLRDKYTGSHLYKAGEYIRLLLPRGGDLNARFANRVTGLQGRSFDDRTKEFLVSLVPAKFSDGKDVADIIALARYLSIDPTPYKKG